LLCSTANNRGRALIVRLLFDLDLVDALSAPIQFMSQAEKRAKQMQEMGIDASDITEIPSSGVTNSQPATKNTPTSSNGRLVASHAQTTQQSNANAASAHNVSNVDKKKGEEWNITIRH